MPEQSRDVLRLDHDDDHAFAGRGEDGIEMAGHAETFRQLRTALLPPVGQRQVVGRPPGAQQPTGKDLAEGTGSENGNGWFHGASIAGSATQVPMAMAYGADEHTRRMPPPAP